MSKPHVYATVVELFDRPGGWYYASVPQSLVEPYYDLQDRGLIAIRATARSEHGELTWPTSFLPMGDGSHFVALPAKVRKRLKIDEGDTVEIEFSIRDR